MRVILPITCALAIVAMPSAAKQPLNFEITPLIGYRFGGDFNTSQEAVHGRVELTEATSYGVIAGWSIDRAHKGEFLVSHYDTDFSKSGDFSASDTSLGITYAHLGGSVSVSEGALPVYVTGGLGLTHFSPEDADLGNETRFSMNVGIASKIPLTERISFLLAGRLYGTFFNSDSAVFCNFDTCAIYVSSSVWVQSELNAGITFKF